MYMYRGRGFVNRIIRFLIFVLLTFVTIGIYPAYFMVSRMEERNELLDNILQELRQKE